MSAFLETINFNNQAIYNLKHGCKSKEEGNYQESIQSNTIPDLGLHMEK